MSWRRFSWRRERVGSNATQMRMRIHSWYMTFSVRPSVMGLILAAALMASCVATPAATSPLVTALREGPGGSGPEGLTLDAGEAVERKREPE